VILTMFLGIAMSGVLFRAASYRLQPQEGLINVVYRLEINR
jgi:hypothetical protein